MSLPIQLISTDFDGTLHADAEDPPVPVALQGLLADVQRQDTRWVINTGRDLSSLMESIARARLTVWPDFVVTVEREIFTHDEGRYVPCPDWNGACAQAHAELFARVQPDVPRLMRWIHERFRATLYADDFSPCCLIADHNQSADEIQAYMDDYCRAVPGLTWVRNDIYGRFSHSAFNKGTALGEIGRQLGVARERIFAAGDHFNDVPMLNGEFAACVGAPDNAIDAVKQLVTRQKGYVSHQPWGHGVARALEHFLGG